MIQYYIKLKDYTYLIGIEAKCIGSHGRTLDRILIREDESINSFRQRAIEMDKLHNPTIDKQI